MVKMSRKDEIEFCKSIKNDFYKMEYESNRKERMAVTNGFDIRYIGSLCDYSGNLIDMKVIVDATDFNNIIEAVTRFRLAKENGMFILVRSFDSYQTKIMPIDEYLLKSSTDSKFLSTYYTDMIDVESLSHLNTLINSNNSYDETSYCQDFSKKALELKLTKPKSIKSI